MAAKDFLAFDLGAESGRAVIGHLDAGRLSLEESHRFANPVGRMLGHLHWNLLAQWEELKIGLRKAGVGRKLAGIGVDTWGVDFGLLDKNGQILGNPYHYRDARTDSIMERAFARVPKEKIFRTTGIQFMQFNSLFQLLAYQQFSPATLAAADRMLLMPDLFNYLFTGVRSSELSVASTSQMYDPVRKSWAVDLLAAMGLPTHILPPIVHSGTVLGNLRKEVAAECGVEPMAVIAPGCHDTASAVAAVPAESGTDGWCYISSGTWSLMGVERPAPVITDKTLKYNYTNEVGVGGSIRLLKNIMGLWLIQECRRQWAREGQEHSYAELTKMAADAPAFGAIIDPDHKPFLSPGEMPAKIAEFCKQTDQPAPQSKGQIVRACLESLALTYRRTAENLEDITGQKIATIHIVGGGAQNKLLNQMTADACGRTVVAGPVEATAIGNILVQAMATGDVKSLADARSIIRQSFEVETYRPTGAARWQVAYERLAHICK